MKKLIFLFLLFPALAFAQDYDYKSDLPIKDGSIVYEKTVDGLDLKKDKLYAVSKKWIADNFSNAKSVIQSEDVNSGQIIAKGISNIPNKPALLALLGDQKYKYTVQFDTKDGKYRMRIYDIAIHVDVNGYQQDSYINDVFLNSKPITGASRIAKAKKTIDNFNTLFNGYLESFHQAVIKAKEDTF